MRQFLISLVPALLFVLHCDKSTTIPDINYSPTFIEIAPFNTKVLVPTDTVFVDQAHPEASDSNDGSENTPWQTISHAVKNAKAGRKIIVKKGNYTERVECRQAGTPEQYIVFEAQDSVFMGGFLLYGDYTAVIGFSIDGDSTIPGWLGGGIWIQANNLYIAHNSITGFASTGGIFASWAAEEPLHDIYIMNNYIYGCNKGITVSGVRWLVENNEIERLMRTANGGDADYFRFFGDTIIIRKNFLHGTRQSEIGQSHTDLFQTYDNNGNEAHNILIEQNMGIDFFHQGLMAEGGGLSHTNIILHKNVFANGTAWGICSHGQKGLHIINNTILFIATHGIGFREGSVGTVKNNIITQTTSSYWADETSSYSNGYNLIYEARNPSPGDSTDIIGEDPLFTNVNNIVGDDNKPFTDDDGLRLLAGSPALKAGEEGVNIGAY